MKKRITMLLCTAVVLLGITVPPALAAGGVPVIPFGRPFRYPHRCL